MAVLGSSYLVRDTYDARSVRLAGFYQEAHMLGVQYTELAAE